MHEVYAGGVPSVYPDVKPRQGGLCTGHLSEPQASGMHVTGLGPASASAGVIGRDRRQTPACFVQG
eukprot:365069-Chlamydomonas_euryale.AAC.26